MTLQQVKATIITAYLFSLVIPSYEFWAKSHVNAEFSEEEFSNSVLHFYMKSFDRKSWNHISVVELQIHCNFFFKES